MRLIARRAISSSKLSVLLTDSKVVISMPVDLSLLPYQYKQCYDISLDVRQTYQSCTTSMTSRIPTRSSWLAPRK